MKPIFLLILLILFNAPVPADTSPANQGDELAQNLFAPELVLKYRQEIGLDDRQSKAVKDLVQKRAEQAREAGIVNKVVEAAAVDAVALQAAQEIAALPAGAVAVSRRLLRGHLDAVVRQIDTEVMHFKDRLQSDEARAAFSAFLSRKK